MLVMPLRITHVDTKVLVLLVQAMPTSLHTACRIPLKTGGPGDSRPQKQETNKPWITSYFQRLCSDAKSEAHGVYFKSAVWVLFFVFVSSDGETQVNNKYLQVKVLSLASLQTSVGSSCIWGSRKQERDRASCCSQWEGWWGLTAAPAARVPAAHWFTVKVDLTGLFP